MEPKVTLHSSTSEWTQAALTSASASTDLVKINEVATKQIFKIPKFIFASKIAPIRDICDERKLNGRDKVGRRHRRRSSASVVGIGIGGGVVVGVDADVTITEKKIFPTEL